ncbi:MAG: methyltransferase domain-containing protein [Phycisphaerales bacterium]|nr:MAG: methyltransferase domain-containing protein [Phycisphaerales bacterium]
MTHKKTARVVAAEALARVDPRFQYAAPILDRLLQQTDEKQRATDLVFGTIRNSAALDMVITRFARCPVERVTPNLLSVIRAASFELIYAPTAPEYSIVNEAVEITKAAAGNKQIAFVNAVLRQVARHLANRRIPLTHAEPARTLPQSPLTGCEFDTDFLPDPNLMPARYLSAAFSLPEWLLDGWINDFGFEQTRRACLASNRRPSIYVNPNTLRTEATILAEQFRQAGIDFEAEPGASMMKLKSPRAVTRLPGFADGLFTIQDLTAAQAVRILEPRPGWKILDLCAAPGAKTMQLAQAAAEKAHVIATDIDDERLKKVKENVERLRVKNVTILPHQALDREPVPTGLFDAVLLDAPCSNTGVLARRVEARHRISPKAITRSTKTQLRLLAKAEKMLRPGGRICYTTCSIQKNENANLVRDFISRSPRLELTYEKLMLPSAERFDHDGGYVALILSK